MSDINQPHASAGPILSINIGPILRPVTKVLSELDNLDTQKEKLEAQIDEAKTQPNVDTDTVGKLERQLARVESEIKLRDDPIKIRHGHLYRRSTADSA